MTGASPAEAQFDDDFYCIDLEDLLSWVMKPSEQYFVVEDVRTGSGFWADFAPSGRLDGELELVAQWFDGVEGIEP